MTKKLKIIISIVAVLLVCCIVGFTIAIVLVANQATATSSMTVTFTSYEVSAKITCSASIVDMYDILEDGVVVDNAQIISTYKLDSEGNQVSTNEINFEAKQANSTENIYFSEAILEDYKYAVRYTFQIVNTGKKSISVNCSTNGLDVTNNNMKTRLKNTTDGVVSTDGTLTTTMAEGQLKVIYFFVMPNNIQEDGQFDAMLNGALAINLTGLDSST